MAWRVPPRASRWPRSTVSPGTWFLLALSLAVVPAASAQQKHIYVGLDDHTDYMWTADEVAYRSAFLSSLDYYLNLADSTAGNAPEFQSRFNTDGSFWMWEYEKNKPAADFDRLISRIRSGHITVPLNGLVSTYGAQPTEAVLRGMYYPGQIERRYDLRFPLVEAMENQTLPLGLSSLWAGAGAKYSWRGVCGCATSVTNLSNRQQEIYRYAGLDGSSVMMKWNSLFGPSTSLGGYAEARDVTASVNFVDTNTTFTGKYPYSVIGAFGKGWDDLQTQTNEFVTLAPTLSNSGRKVIVSNEVDFFTDFDATYGAASLPSLTQSHGNEWDLYSASLAEVSSSVRRSVEKLRGAEGLATLVSLVDPAFWTSRKTARDKAWMDLGLYWEHDWTADGPVTRPQREAWERRLATEVSSYVDSLQTDAVTMMGSLIPRPAATERFFVYNPLSWARDDVAEIPRSDASPVHVVDVSTGTEIPSQLVTVDGEQRLRVLASGVPPMGYRVFEIVPGTGTTFSQAATVAGRVFSNGLYQVTVADRGAITSLLDLRRGSREFAASVGGAAVNDLGGGAGSLTVENSGPVSVTLKAASSGPISHESRITLLRNLDRIDIRNDITQNFSDVRTWAFGFNLTNPDVRHEELGAILRAKLLANGGHYSPVNARYSWLTLNHFADMTDGAGVVGVTLSNADTSFMRLGSSSATTLDTATPQISPLAGGQVDGTLLGIQGQGGDTHFLQRFALRTHDSYDQASAMRFALEHQNPFVTGTVAGGTGYPGDTYSFLTISDPSVLLWAMKPAEEGIDQGVITRVWNLGTSASSFALSLAPTVVSANQTTHIETVIGPATVTGGVLAGTAPAQGIVTYRLQPGSSTGPPLPVADAQSLTTNEDAATPVTLTGSDPQGGALTYTVLTGPTHGTLSGTAPSLTYTPGANYNGADSFTFNVTDPFGAASAAATVSITITPVNDPPVANPQSVSVGSGGSVAVTLGGSDVDGDPLTFAVVTGPAQGALTGTPPALSYTPSAGYSGADSFTFSVTDPSNASSTATVSIAVIANSPPTGNGQSVTTNEDTPKAIVLTGSDPESGALVYTVVAAPAHGTLSGVAPNLTYSPAANYNGADGFTFKVTDPLALASAPATVSITVAPVNDAPVATSQSVSVAAGGSVPIVLTGSDVDGDTLTFVVTIAPAHGAVSGTPPNLTYFPTAGYAGADSFTFTVQDPSAASSTATVSITVTNTPPTANVQSVTTNEDAAKAIALTGSDPEGGALTYAVVTGPAHGALGGTAPSLTYTPTANYNGSDSFTFRVTDLVGAASAAATVSITVAPVNDAPVANPQSVPVTAGGSVAVTLTASDVDGDLLTFAVVSIPAHGSLTGTPPALTYTPIAGYSGADSFTFKANDATLDSPVATVSITVSSALPNWWNAAWTQRRKLVFNAAARTTNLVNFPVLVKLDGTRIDYSATLAGGADLRFVDADGVTVLSHEVEQWSPAGTSTVWVKVPQIDAGSATDFIWLYYGNSAAADGQNRAGVWSGSYRGVWHLTDFTDATGNAHTGTNAGSTTATGRFGGARRFDGVSGHIVVPQAASLSFAAGESYSLSTWVQLGSLASKWVGVVVKSRNLSPWYGVGINPSNRWVGRSPTNVIGSLAAVGWSHVVVVQDGAANTRRLYVNGVQVATGTAKAANGTGDLWIGGAASTTEYLNGVVDEVRLAGLARPADWVAAEYLSETDAFVTYVVDAAPAPPSIVTNPASQTVTAGQTATFSVVANGAAPLSYQWQRGGANIAGATASTYTTPATTLADTGAVFLCVVSNSAGSATSASATLTVQPPNQPPTANGQAVTGNEDTTTAITLSGSDPEGGALVYSVVNAPAHGTLSGIAPTLTYSPAVNYNGPDSFTFKVTDTGGLASTAATVSITVTPVNDPPVANPQSAAVATGASMPIVLTGSDVDGDPITFLVTAPPLHGTISGTAPNIAYSAAPGYAGADSFVFTVTDPSNASSTATISITVTNAAPAANPQSVATNEDTAATIALTGSDPEGGVLAYTVVTTPAHGTLSGTAPSLMYTPTLNYNGPDSFTFKVTDPVGAVSTAATVSITVTPVNDPPVANPQSVSVGAGGSLAVALTGSDVDGDPLTYAVVTGPVHGTLTGTPPALSYTPSAGYSGADTFTFSVTDPSALSSTATVSITVVANNPPTANGQSVTTNEDTSKAIVLTGSDPEGGALVYAAMTTPAHGTLSGVAPNLTYSPAANYNGPDGFAFTVTDPVALSSAPATVSITVAPVNDPPVATPQSVSVAAGGSVPIVLAGTDVDGDPLTFAVTVAPLHGTISGTVPNLIYSAATSYAGADNFTFRVSDSSTASSTAIVSITVTNSAPTAAPQSVTTNEDTAKAIVLTGSDPEGGALTYAVVTGPAHGTLTGTAPSLTYAPAANYNGADSFTFKVTDPVGAASTTATVSITVTPVNDPPVANPQSVSVVAGSGVPVTLTGSDVDGDPLTFAVVTGPAHGSLTGTPPALTYAPTAGYSGADSFTFKANDATVDSPVATVSITVSAASPPVISAVAATSVQSTSATITWTTNVASSSQVDYGTTTAYGTSTTLDSTLVTAHSQGISTLLAGTLYHYRVRSVVAGSAATSPDATFTTTATTTLVGDTKVETNVDGNSVGLAEAFQYTATTTGTAGKAVVYLDSTVAASRVTVGVYTDNANNPGSLLAQATVTTVVRGAWNTVALPAASITAGTRYWIAILSPTGSAGAVAFRDLGAGTRSVMCSTTSLAALPATWTSGTAYSNSPMSAYITP